MGRGGVTYVVSFPLVLNKVRLPVIGCPVVAHSAGQQRENFVYIQFLSQIAVVQEENDPLSHCDLCDMHMPAGRLIKHQRTQRRYSNTQMRWRRRDVAIASRCTEASFILTGEYEAECIEGVDNLKYLGHILDWSDDD